LISFRNHVVTLVAVFLALAVGVALGGGPLSQVGRGAVTSTAGSADVREAEAEADFGDEFAAAAGGRLYAGGLDTAPVAVVTLPGAPDGIVKGVTAEVERAGGAVSASYAVQPALLNPSEKSLVDTLGSQLVTQLDKESVDEGAPTYERIGQLLGTGVASTSAQGAAADSSTSSILQSLGGAELLTGPESPSRRAPLVLVVLGDDADDDILAGLVAGLAATSVGVVAVGHTDAADLSGLRTSPLAEPVATVDGAERPLGQVTTTLALIRSLSTTGGSFGASGSDRTVPLG
jgi:hypothetical protein